MSTEKWAEINERIRRCHESIDPLACLLRLFQETGDGWVAFNIGKIFERDGKHFDALKYYKLARERLPLEKYKKLAEEAINRVKAHIFNNEVIFIVSCTREKIWNKNTNAEKYVPAKEAYTGDIMRKWLASEEAKKYKWLIFSSKYGFIEPDHPIKNYDIHFTKDPGAISEETLRRQILYHEFDGFRIKDFKKVYFVGSREYYIKLKLIFKSVDMEIDKYDP